MRAEVYQSIRDERQLSSVNLCRKQPTETKEQDGFRFYGASQPTVDFLVVDMRLKMIHTC